MKNNPMNGTDSLDPISMFTITSKLYSHVRLAVREILGTEGLEQIEAGVKNLEAEQYLYIEEDADRSVLFTSKCLLDDQEVKKTFHLFENAQKKAGREPLTMYAVMAKMFAHITKSVVDRFGSPGQEAVMNGVAAFGAERGRDIARRASVNGLPNTMDHYLSNYDMGRSDLFEYETLFHPVEIEQTFTTCAFGDQWKKDGMGEYGILYCKMIDPSIAKGYNPNFEVIHDQYLLTDGNCHFRFQMKEKAAASHE